MSEISVTEKSTFAVAIPGTGEIASLETPANVAEAIDKIDYLIENLKYAKRVVAERAVELSMEYGARTLPLEDGRKLVLSPAEATVYDADELRAALSEAGMPEERLNEIVVPTVTFKVNALKAKSASSANPAYREAIEAHTTVEPRIVYASVKKG